MKGECTVAPGMFLLLAQRTGTVRVTSDKGDCHMARAGKLTLSVQGMPAISSSALPRCSREKMEFGEVMSQKNLLTNPWVRTRAGKPGSPIPAERLPRNSRSLN